MSEIRFVRRTRNKKIYNSISKKNINWLILYIE